MRIEPLRINAPESIEILDQAALPFEERRLVLDSVAGLISAIQVLSVRGAPLLGTAAACGMALASRDDAGEPALRRACEQISAARPTAVDLGACARAALQQALAVHEAGRREALWDFAAELHARRLAEDRAIGEAGAALLAPGSAVLTHCNAGALATGGIGTALGVVNVAWASGRLSRCYATETRPLLQGARLTAWELKRLGIPVTLLPDTAAASLIRSGRVQAVVTGADRIAANGDTANKIGTVGLALAAADAGIPFYIAAPWTTIDLECPDGEAIPIEFRSASEVGGFGDQRWAPDGLDAFNPAFDVTPARLITAIITERGVLRPPYGDSLS